MTIYLYSRLSQTPTLSLSTLHLDELWGTNINCWQFFFISFPAYGDIITSKPIIYLFITSLQILYIYVIHLNCLFQALLVIQPLVSYYFLLTPDPIICPTQWNFAFRPLQQATLKEGLLSRIHHMGKQTGTFKQKVWE